MRKLSFSKDGKFKIVQFTDTHYLEANGGGDTPEEKAQYVAAKRDVVLATVNGVLDSEKPDFVIFTGDNVATREQPLEAWRHLVSPMISREIPWAVVMGNHDYEYTGITQNEIMAFLSTLPCSLSQCGPAELGGGGNYLLSVTSYNSPQVKASFYCLDSGDYADHSISDGYAWFSFRQMDWFRNQAQALSAANGGVPIPSLAFFHIPFPEYREVLMNGKTVGEKMEKVCCPKLNSGMFTAMLESKSIVGTFVGHDHNNDCVASLHGMCLAYGRKTGEFSYHCLPCGGARVIELEEGSRHFSTWIRKATGEVDSLVRHPDDFLPVP